MLFVIASHFSFYGTWNPEKIKNSLHLLKVMQFQPLGQAGVYLFVMISAYFLSTRKVTLTYIWDKIKILWKKTYFYSIFCLILAIVLHLKINMHNLLRSIFPITFNQYWFMTSFILLMFIVPMLNEFIATLNKKTFQKYLLVFVMVADIYPILGNSPLGGFLSVSVMISAYLLSAYIRKFKIKVPLSLSITMIVTGLGLQYLSIYLLNELHKSPLILTNGILPLMIAVGIFTFSAKLPDFYNAKINYISSSVLAAYLLSVNHFYIRWIWKTLLVVRNYENSHYLTLIGVGLSILILLASVLFDKLVELIHHKVSLMIHNIGRHYKKNI